MSRIPVFIEKKNRKNWNKTTGACLFISCDSVGNSELEGDVSTGLDEFTNGAENNFTRVQNVSLFSDDESVNGLRFDEDNICHIDTVQDAHNTSISLTVVSCSKGVVNATCNCAVCLANLGNQDDFDDGLRHNEMHVEMSENNELEVNDVIGEFAKDVKSRSLLPKPGARLTAGRVAMTPAPVKRSKSKHGKQVNDSTVNNKCEGKSNRVTSSSVRISKLPVKATQDAKTKVEIKSSKHDPSDGKRRGFGHTDKTGVAISKSYHDFEDSEPECAQHEKRSEEMKANCALSVRNDGENSNTTVENKADDLQVVHCYKHVDEVREDKKPEKYGQETGEIYWDEMYREQPNYKDIKVMNINSNAQTFFKETVHENKVEQYSFETFINDPKSHSSTEIDHITHDSPQPKNILRSTSIERSPSRSQIPVRASRSPDRVQCSQSPNQSLSSVSRESSHSPARSSVHSICGLASKLPPRSPVYSRNSPSVSKRPPLSSGTHTVSPQCVSIKSPSPNRSHERLANAPLNNLTSVAKKQIKTLKSNNQGTECSEKDVKLQKSSIPKLVLNKKACPRAINTEKRNLPKAPERRTLRYGQRCLSVEEINSAGSTSNQAANGSAGPKANGAKKRPAWDLKGRLQDMEEEMQKKNEQMTKWSEIMGTLESSNKQLSGSAAQNEQMFTSVSKEKDFLKTKLEETQTELIKIQRELERERENFEFTKGSLKRQKDALETQLSEMQTQVTRLQSSLTQITSSQEILQSELTSTKVSLDKALNEIKDKDAEITELRANKLEFEEKFRLFETERRVLHNTIQELKGNIRVFCRVRPLLGEELLGNDGEIHHMNFPDDDNKTIEIEKLGDINFSETIIQGTKRSANGRYSFSFDKVFLPASSQTEVFEEISQLVQSALDGYNVCIFAYGQTGSGKTYTMEGPSVEDEETMGMISRATIQIFQNTKDLEDKGWQYEFEASFLEIYNESIRDLLGNHGPDAKHDIKLGPGGKDVVVTNLTTQSVTRREQIITLLRTASKNRAVGVTNCNERSSRSHSVFRLKITGSNDITGESCAGTLNLIDLAGSERLKESGATGQRLKETQNINKSLANLGNVIMALANKDPHVPYRNSKLTYLLQNSLGGNSKTLMFVNVSPREEHFSETVNSLRFATKVNQCNIGTATKKTR